METTLFNSLRWTDQLIFDDECREGPSGRHGRSGPSGTPGPPGARGDSGNRGPKGESGTYVSLLFVKQS